MHATLSKSISNKHWLVNWVLGPKINLNTYLHEFLPQQSSSQRYRVFSEYQRSESEDLSVDSCDSFSQSVRTRYLESTWSTQVIQSSRMGSWRVDFVLHRRALPSNVKSGTGDWSERSGWAAGGIIIWWGKKQYRQNNLVQSKDDQGFPRWFCVHEVLISKVTLLRASWVGMLNRCRCSSGRARKIDQSFRNGVRVDVNYGNSTQNPTLPYYRPLDLSHSRCTHIMLI